VIGLAPQDEKWLDGQSYVGVWHENAEDARKRQEALDVVPHGKYQALVVSPLASGRLNPPDICLVYATPGQMIILINGLQWIGYKKFEWGVVGETACADSWGRALKTGEPQPVAALLCGAALWWRTGRRDVDGAAAIVSRQGDHGHEGAIKERLALSDRSLWYPKRRARRNGRLLRQEKCVALATNASETRLRPRIASGAFCFRELPRENLGTCCRFSVQRCYYCLSLPEPALFGPDGLIVPLLLAPPRVLDPVVPFSCCVFLPEVAPGLTVPWLDAPGAVWV